MPMLRGIMEMSARNQVICVTPFTLSGAMAPVTLAGALAQQNAEALAGIAFTQLVRPGAPVIYGGFTSNVDMKSGAPAFGTPEYMKTAIIGGQLARRYKLPYRTSNVNAANTVDAQAAYESVFSLWGVVMGHGNLVKHAAGWMEGGLCASFEKLVLDVDLLQMVAQFLQPLEVNEARSASKPCAMSGPAAISSAPPTPRPLQGRLLRADHFRLAQFRKLGGSRQAARLAEGQRHASSRPCRTTSRRRLTRRSATNSTPSSRSAARKAARRRISDVPAATLDVTGY